MYLGAIVIVTGTGHSRSDSRRKEAGGRRQETGGMRLEMETTEDTVQ